MGSPAEVLAAAREHPVGPFLPAREEWLAGWTGPVEMTNSVDNVWREIAWSPALSLALAPFVRLDPRRPEVRDLLVRRGCPEWARELPAAVWCWGMGVGINRAHAPWKPGSMPIREPVACEPDEDYSIWCWDDAEDRQHSHGAGWRVDGTYEEGPETGPEGRACADLAALRAGCILEEAGDPRDPTKPPGWYVPLPGGGVGWWAKEGSDAG